MKFILTLILTISFIPFAFASEQFDETVQFNLLVDGLNNSKGNLMVAIYDNSQAFPSHPEMAIKLGKIKAMEGSMGIGFPEFTPGIYAIAIFQDENENGKLDTNIVGMPKEPFGFSNNPKINFRAPTFEEAKIELHSSEEIFPIHLNHMFFAQ